MKTLFFCGFVLLLMSCSDKKDTFLEKRFDEATMEKDLENISEKEALEIVNGISTLAFNDIDLNKLTYGEIISLSKQYDKGETFPNAIISITAEQRKITEYQSIKHIKVRFRIYNRTGKIIEQIQGLVNLTYNSEIIGSFSIDQDYKLDSGINETFDVEIPFSNFDDRTQLIFLNDFENVIFDWVLKDYY